MRIDPKNEQCTPCGYSSLRGIARKLEQCYVRSNCTQNKQNKTNPTTLTRLLEQTDKNTQHIHTFLHPMGLRCFTITKRPNPLIRYMWVTDHGSTWHLTPWATRTTWAMAITFNLLKPWWPFILHRHLSRELDIPHPHKWSNQYNTTPRLLPWKQQRTPNSPFGVGYDLGLHIVITPLFIYFYWDYQSLFV